MFKDILKDISSRIEGTKGVVLTGLDGITIEKHVVDGEINLEAFSAEYMSLLKKSIAANEELGMGKVMEFTIMTDKMIAIIRAITKEYYLIFALTPRGNFGQARFQIRKAIPRLLKELT
jgi:predicted regulator of Ras-like GTPase activity (Roadblock/LC7/MglB family)